MKTLLPALILLFGHWVSALPVQQESKTRSETSSEPSPLLQCYLQLQTALAADDLEGARQAVSSLKAEATGPLSKSVLELEKAETLEALRNGFHPLSQQIIAAEQIPALYMVVHCPMARGNEGADWIQKKGAIRNPYYGASMLTCGVRVPL